MTLIEESLPGVIYVVWSYFFFLPPLSTSYFQVSENEKIQRIDLLQTNFRGYT